MALLVCGGGTGCLPLVNHSLVAQAAGLGKALAPFPEAGLSLRVRTHQLWRADAPPS